MLALFAIYVVLKYVAYAWWCSVGLRLFNRALRARVAAALGFGLLRLVIGLFFGFIIASLSTWIYTTFSSVSEKSVLIYLSVYVPVRWIEWSILGVVIAPGARTLKSFLIGLNRISRGWRLGGIMFSCLADIPIIVSMGGVVPVGRFLC